MGESTEGVSAEVLGLGCWGLGVGPTATLRLGAWVRLRGWGVGLMVVVRADGDGVRGPRLLGDAAAWRAVMLGLRRQVAA